MSGALDAAVERSFGDLLDRERAVGAGVGERAGLERLATCARAGRVVGDGDVGVGGLETGGPRLDADLLSRGAAAGELAGQSGGVRVGGGFAAAAFVRGASGECEGRDRADGADLGNSGELHCESFTIVRFVPGAGHALTVDIEP